MEWHLLNKEQQSAQVIKALKLLCFADDKVNENELKFILEVGRMHGMNAEQVMAYLKEENIQLILPADEQERMTIMYYLIFLMKADHEINDSEEEAIKHFGLKLGFREELMNDFIHLAKKYLGQNIPPSEMLEKIKKYLN